MTKEQLVKIYEQNLIRDHILYENSKYWFYVTNMLHNSSWEELKVFKDHIGDKIEEAVRRHKLKGVLKTHTTVG